MQAPQWYRDVAGPGGLERPPPPNLMGGKLTPAKAQPPPPSRGPPVTGHPSSSSSSTGLAPGQRTKYMGMQTGTTPRDAIRQSPGKTLMPSVPMQRPGNLPALPGPPSQAPALALLPPPPQAPALAILPPPPPPAGATSSTSALRELALVPAEKPTTLAVAASPTAAKETKQSGPSALALLEAASMLQQPGRPAGGKAKPSAAATSTAIVSADPKASTESKAFMIASTDGNASMIPGLQARPFTEDELSIAWDMIDLDRHDFLQAQDLRRTLELCGEEGVTDAELEAMVRMLDKDGGGKVFFPEFWEAFTDPPPLFRNFDLHRRSSAGDDEMADERDLSPKAGSTSGSSEGSPR